jgi:CHAT domain-containing protein
LPVIEVPQASGAAAAENFKPYDHPKYWAAFILIGDPN